MLQFNLSTYLHVQLWQEAGVDSGLRILSCQGSELFTLVGHWAARSGSWVLKSGSRAPRSGSWAARDWNYSLWLGNGLPGMDPGLVGLAALTALAGLAELSGLAALPGLAGLAGLAGSPTIQETNSIHLHAQHRQENFLNIPC